MIKLSAVFSVQAILAAFFGLCVLLVPELLLELYGTKPEPSNLYFARLLGSASIGIAMISWGARQAIIDRKVMFVPAFATANSLAAVAAVQQALIGQTHPIRWLSAAMFLVLAALFVYHTFSTQPAR